MIAWTDLARRWRRSRERAFVALVVVFGALVARRGADVDPAAASAESGVAGAFGRRGLSCAAGDVSWVGPERGERRGIERYARALVRARTGPGEPSDLYLVVVRVSPEGAVLEVGEEHDVTNTTGVDESLAVVRGEIAAYTASNDGLVTGIHLLDLRGRSDHGGDFTFVQRQQAAITNLQQTGQASRSCTTPSRWTRWRTERPSPGGATGCSRPASMTTSSSSTPATHAWSPARPSSASSPTSRRGRATSLTWAVDRVRSVPSFGDDRMQWLTAVVFTALDKWNATFSHGTTAKDVEDELGLAAPPAAATAPGAIVDPEVGWPPAPMHVPVSPPLPGEGRWIALDKDPFITPAAAGTPPAFVTSFLRPNVHRQDVRVYMTLWDPRQIALHMEAGTVEPISANGEHGPGMVPRTPEVMKHFVAAFNGGFQAQRRVQHAVERHRVPTPQAVRGDGHGAPGRLERVRRVASSERGQGQRAGSGGGHRAPAEPHCAGAGRALAMGTPPAWWGGTPPGWPDQIHSARSAICMTTEGFVGYRLQYEHLRRGSRSGHAQRPVQLRDPPRHEPGARGLRVLRRRSRRAAPGARAADAERLGGRRQGAGHGAMGLPREAVDPRDGSHAHSRYIQRKARDFFYLTARPILQAAQFRRRPVRTRTRASGAPRATAARVSVCARNRVGEGGGRRRGSVLRADPRHATCEHNRRAGNADGAGCRIQAASGARRTTSLWWSRERLLGAAAGSDGGHVDRSRSAAGSGQANAAGGRGREQGGMLAWSSCRTACRRTRKTASAMDAVLARMGCSTRMLIPGNGQALLGGNLDASGAPVAAGLAPVRQAAAELTVRLVREHAPDAHPMFTDTPIVPLPVVACRFGQTRTIASISRRPLHRVLRRASPARRLGTRSPTRRCASSASPATIASR